MSACVSACLPGDSQRETEMNKERKRERYQLTTCHHASAGSPLTVSIYQRVNLWTGVLQKPAWKTSASSWRHLMLTWSVWHGKETHAHPVWELVMSAWSHTLYQTYCRPQCGGGVAAGTHPWEEETFAVHEAALGYPYYCMLLMYIESLFEQSKLNASKGSINYIKKNLKKQQQNNSLCGHAYRAFERS